MESENIQAQAPPEAPTKNGAPPSDHTEEPPSKKARLDDATTTSGEKAPTDARDARDARDQRRGYAPVKAEYVHTPWSRAYCVPDRVADHPRFIIQKTEASAPAPQADPDDAAEAAGYDERQDDRDKKGGKKNKAAGGANYRRDFGRSHDAKGLCSSRMFTPEFSPATCGFGEKCRFEHDLRTYLKDHKREDLTVFNGVCPVWDAKGKCFSGWKCRFVGSHMIERDTEDGRKELVLTEDEDRKKKAQPVLPFVNEEGLANVISMDEKMALSRRKVDVSRSDTYISWQLEQEKVDKTMTQAQKDDKEEYRARYVEPPFLPSEKRRLYFGPETPALAPLTTQGNLPFRRVCTELGAQLTYSEMAMSMPLIQGNKSEWALLKGHESEMLPPTVTGKDIVQGYDNTKDLKFGAQIASNKPWQAYKATEVLSRFTPNLRVIDLNCGCPIDLLFRDGAGSALLEHPSKLEKILRGMNAVSQEIPISVKIRMGTRDNAPNALKLTERLLLGGFESHQRDAGPPGIAALTLHGRSRQQRYTKLADWGYISECAALIKRLNQKTDEVTDTIREPDARHQPNGGKTYFLGNGDCYSHVDYDDHINNAGVDSVMVGRGALIKPWVFEEIQTGQYLDKSATERLTHIEKFAKYGLETWGSDEHGIGTTRRFLCEWLSFTYRYVPIGLLEYLPPNIQDRPPLWRGRNELETLLGSPNYKDWIKITYVSYTHLYYNQLLTICPVRCSSVPLTRISNSNLSINRMPMKRRAKPITHLSTYID